MKDFLNYLAQLGIDTSLAIAGFLGSLAMIGKKIKDGKKMSKLTVFVSTGVGVLSAVYITPLVLLVIKLEGNGTYGIGFLCGYLGLEGIEMLIKKYKSTHGAGPEHQ